MKRITRSIATVIASIGAILALAGTAQAKTEPINRGNGPGAVTHNLNQATAPDVSSQGWSPAVIVGLVLVAVLVTCLFVAGQQIARHRRRLHSPALGV